MSTEIYNMALGLLGDFEVTTSTPATNKAMALCTRYYAQARDEILSEHTWNEAMVTVELDTTATGEDDWPYYVDLPSGTLRIVSVDDDEVVWHVEGTKLYIKYRDLGTTFDLDSVTVEYVSQLTDTTLFSVNLKKAIAYQLAIYMATSLVGADTPLRQNLLSELERLVLPKARGLDASQNKLKYLMKSQWLRSRS
jgi:hypothetical protein